MGDTVAPRERASVGHFESGGRHYEGTPAEQASEVAALPTLIVGSELCHDDVFMGLAGEADGDPQLAYALAALREAWSTERSGSGHARRSVAHRQFARASNKSAHEHGSQ
jgi:hypothetical protein